MEKDEPRFPAAPAEVLAEPVCPISTYCVKTERPSRRLRQFPPPASHGGAFELPRCGRTTFPNRPEEVRRVVAKSA